MLHIKKLIASAVLLLMLTQVKGQHKITLRIGDPAPAIKYSKWLKGGPITSFKGDQLYVVEFWATWCGPCKAAMPHLTKLQKEYEGKATFISVNVWEKLKEGQTYESSLPPVESFVKGNSANMGFSVFADNNDQHMGNNWLHAAGEKAIPSTFIIKDEKLIWIGHPLALDTVLPKILNGSYNMAAFKAKFDKSADRSQKTWDQMLAFFKPVQDALAAKEYKKALQLAEKLKEETKNPDWRQGLDGMKFNALLKLSEKDAIRFAGQWVEEYLYAPSSIYRIVSQESNLSKSTYLWAAKLKEKDSAGPSLAFTSPLYFHQLAAVYAKGGDYQKAIAVQQDAIERAKAALAEGEWAQHIMVDTIPEYEEALAGYKKAAKAAKSFPAR